VGWTSGEILSRYCSARFLRVLACPPDSPELRLGGDDDNVSRPSRVHVAHAPDRGIACAS
jgi:hypothetical protein